MAGQGKTETDGARITGAPLAPYERRTVPQLVFGAIDRFGDAEAFRWKENGAWVGLSHEDVADRVARLSAAFRRRGLIRGDRVALLSENRLEWALTDFATICAGGITVPVYPSLPADQVALILEDAEPRIAVVSTPEQLAKVLAVRDRIPALEHVVLVDGDPEAEAAGAGGTAVVERWRALLATAPEREFRRDALRAQPSDPATLIYTSGTTGTPKGAVLSHANLAYMVAATRQHGPVPASAGEVALSILPLSHVLERAAFYYFWDTGVVIAYAESIDAVSDNLVEVRPHVMVSVPRLFEKIHERVVGGGGLKGRIARWAGDVGGRVVDRRLAGRHASPADRARFALADRLVFRVLRERTGGRLRSFISGGAPLAPDVARFFFAAGMPIYEGYGLTETSPVLATNQPGAARLATVGHPYPDVELRLGPDDELLARTPGLMQGYWKNPDATAAAIDPDGWFHTGDIASIDEDGYVRITDRLKDLIVTAGGKNIAPQPIELHASRSPYVAQAVMVGDRRPFPILLVVPDWERLATWAAEEGVPLEDRERAARHPALVGLLERETLGRMDRFARYETPKRLAIVPEELTVEGGLLTPTLKVRRRKVEARYRELIDGLYARARKEFAGRGADAGVPSS